MESHISHIFADIFTSRPKAYSKKGLRQLLKLRLLKVNNKDIKNMYFNNFRTKEVKLNHSSTYYNEYDNYYNKDEKSSYSLAIHFDIIHTLC